MHLERVSCELNEIPREMRIFSLSMRSLFSSYTVQESSTEDCKFRMLRNATRNDAVVYIKCVLPLVKQCVLDLKEYFRYFQALTFDEWWDNIDDIVKEVNDHTEFCKLLIAIHEEIITDLKKRQDTASVLMGEMKALSERYEKLAKDFQDRADRKFAWATALLFFPVVNVIATPLLRYSANNDLAESIEKAFQADIQIAAAAIVRDTLVPALSSFVDGLQAIAGFFEDTEGQLITVQRKGEKAKAAQEAKLLHYKSMRDSSREIMDDCKHFLELLPAIRSDLYAIPTDPGDDNYVDRWLERQAKAIRHKFSNESFVVKMLTTNSGNTI